MNFFDRFDFTTDKSNTAFFTLGGAYDYALSHNLPWVKHVFKRTFLSEYEEEWIRLF